jgi:RNA polymerase sigma-70 factor, ECF subfamily
MTKFDPVLLELGKVGEDGERLVFHKYQRRVQRFFEARGISQEEAHDLAQETFLRVFRSEARLDNRAQLEAWLFEIARNVRANALRHKATLKRAAIEVSLDEASPGEALMSRDNPPLLEREQIELLQSALAELPEQMRQCVRLRLRGDLNYEEIAQVMQLSTQTVRSNLRAARNRLQSKLEPRFGRIDF